MNVSARPPSATPRRVISARPRVTSAARAFSPRARPSHRPQAIASTFLTAPPTSAPDQVVVGIDPHAAAVECGHERIAHLRMRAGRDQRGGLLARDLEGEARTGERTTAHGRCDLRLHLMAQQAGRAGFEPLAEPADGRGARRKRLQHRPQAGHRRRDDDQVAGPGKRHRVAGGDGQGGRQGDVGQVPVVATLRLQGGRLRGVARPQRGLVVAGGIRGQRRAPRTRAEHEQLHAGPDSVRPTR